MNHNIFVISDTHFNHTNIIKYCDRPFKNSDEMNDRMIKNWNSVVKDNDIVYHLGDVWMTGNPELLYNLRGRKRLIVGNHDKLKNPILHKVFQKIMMWRMFPEYGLLLTHVPVHESALFRGATGNEKNPKQLLNVHGHIHNNPSPKGPYKCVCVEQINYTPISIEELKQ